MEGMTELGRVGISGNFRISGVFRRFCKSARSAHLQRVKFMECVHSDGSTTFQFIIRVEKMIHFAMKSK